MSTEHIISLLEQNKRWSEWETCYKTIFCLMFLPLCSEKYGRADRAEARRLNVHLFNRHVATPPLFVQEFLETIPQLTTEGFYARAQELRPKVLKFAPTRPHNWPAIN